MPQPFHVLRFDSRKTTKRLSRIEPQNRTDQRIRTEISIVAQLAEHVTVFQFLNERSNCAKQKVEFSRHHFWDKFRKVCGWCNRMWWRVLENVRPKLMVNLEVCGC